MKNRSNLLGINLAFSEKLIQSRGTNGTQITDVHPTTRYSTNIFDFAAIGRYSALPRDTTVSLAIRFRPITPPVYLSRVLPSSSRSEATDLPDWSRFLFTRQRLVFQPLFGTANQNYER